MKLIEAHIENFGKLSGENFKFNSHLNEFYKENGWGKSTLAAFIKVMLLVLKMKEPEMSCQMSEKDISPGRVVSMVEVLKFR